jgi:hypothetical protein
VFDYNGDGRPDIFFTNGAETPSLDKASAGTGIVCTVMTETCDSRTATALSAKQSR